MKDRILYWGTCPYVHEFPSFPTGVISRPCVLKDSHKGNHVVVEPANEKLLEVPL
jgi:hypothetical protein